MIIAVDFDGTLFLDAFPAVRGCRGHIPLFDQ